MNCERAQEYLSDYLERMLDRAAQSQLEGHLSGCEACREALAGLKSTFQALDALPQAEPPADLALRVMARVRDVRQEERAARKTSLTGFLEWLQGMSPARFAVGAALATLVVGGLIGLLPGPRHAVMNILGLRGPEQEATAPAPVGMPVFRIAYGQRDPSGNQPVDLFFHPRSAPAGARLVLRGAGRETEVAASMVPGTTVQIPVILEATGEPAQSLRLEYAMTDGSVRPLYLVVLPRVRNGSAPFTLVLEKRELELGLRELAPHVGKAIIVDASLEGRISLGIEDGQPMEALRAVAGQLGATLREEGGGYTLSAGP